jgi:hypothetical protein
MTISMVSRRLNWLVSLITLTVILSACPAFAQFYDLEIKVSDTIGFPGDENSVISVYMKNWEDTVAGFELWLVLEKPDIMEFQTSFDTLADTIYWKCTEGSWPGSCTDSADVTDSVLLDSNYNDWDNMVITEYEAYVGNHSVEGTLIEDWEYVSSSSIGALGHDLKLAGQANQIRPPYTQGIGYPQTGNIPLIKMLADIYDIPDSLTGEDRQCRIFIQADNLDNFSFSDQIGNTIGVITDTFYDTNWFICSLWYADTCILWREVANGPIDSVDSFWCCDTILSGRLDTTKVKITHATLTVLQGMCGDVNCTGNINLLDITFLIMWIYQSGDDPCSTWAADANGDGNYNLLDITYLINYVYMSGPAPVCS